MNAKPMADDKEDIQHEESNSDMFPRPLDTPCDEAVDENDSQESSRFDHVVVSAATDTVEVASEAKEPGYVTRTFLRIKNQFAEKWPRLFHLTFRVLAPLFGLIGVSFLCGYLLALEESGLEVASNDENIAHLFNVSFFFSSIALGRTVDHPCLAVFDVNRPTLNETGLRVFLDDCSGQFLELSKLSTPIYENPTFDWILCGDEPMPYSDQLKHVLDAWTEDYFDKVVTLAAKGMTFKDANDIALSAATGHDDCNIHVAAGALFWFTLMTTMGYGNTAPETAEGRTLVYTLGFTSILLFGGVIRSAGSICIAVSDDFFIRHRLKWLAKGFASALFWFFVLFFWLLFSAWIFVLYEKNSGGHVISFADSIWFIYISTTTVGFGDFYIEPTSFKAQDMFTFPFLFLIGFVIVANFIHKLAESLADKLPNYGESLEATLEATRKASNAEDSQRAVLESSNDEKNECLAEAMSASPRSTTTAETMASVISGHG